MEFHGFQTVAGLALPARDTHFAARLEASPLVGGRGTYQLGKLRNAIALCTRRRLAIDVGAQCGLWTRVLAGEFERVVAIEPVPEHVGCLARNTAGLLNVDIRQCALGEAPGRLLLRRSDGIATARVCGEEDFELSTPAFRLDDLALDEVDFLKLDCEGYEHFVVLGGERTIRRDRPVVIVEQKKRYVARYGLDRRQPTVKLLQSWGAQEYWANAGDHCLGWPQ